MTTPLKYLMDAEFQAHADYLAECRASIKQAATATVWPVDRQVLSASPVSGTASPVHRPEGDESTRRERLFSDVQSFMADVFDLGGDEEAERDDERRIGRVNG